MWKTNKIPRQGICTTYVGRRRPSVLPKERRHKGLPCQILEAQAKLVGLGASTLQMGIHPKGERKNDMGRPSFGEQGPWLYFQQGLLYPKLHIEDNRGCEIMQSQQSLILIETRVSFLQTIQMV